MFLKKIYEIYREPRVTHSGSQNDKILHDREVWNEVTPDHVLYGLYSQLDIVILDMTVNNVGIYAVVDFDAQLEHLVYRKPHIVGWLKSLSLEDET